jgi:hypothetical protein
MMSDLSQLGFLLFVSALVAMLTRGVHFPYTVGLVLAGTSQRGEVVQLAGEIMPHDTEEFANQFPAYRENPVEETGRALAALEAEQHFAQRYTDPDGKP